MYEHRKHPLAPRRVFLLRVLRSFAGGSILISVSLAIGMSGYHFIENLPWMNAYQEAAMILSGMGPIAPMQTEMGKFFAGTYALYSGLMLVASIGVIIAPIAHRFFHKFHLET